MPSTLHTGRPTLTIGVLAKNEAHQIERCLRSAAFADEVIVVDSGSSDATVEIAQRLGAKTYVYADWQGFAVQRNRLLQHASGDYILFLDADEEITPRLQAEIEAAVRSAQDGTWKVTWQQVAFGKPLHWMRGSQGVVRMFHASNLVRFEGLVHEGPVLTRPDLPTQQFQAHLLHYSRESIYASLLKMAQYVQLGAAKRAQKGKRGGVLRGLGSGIANFLRLYIFQLGFLCGPQGFLFCLMIGLECFFRYAAIEYDPILEQPPASR